MEQTKLTPSGKPFDIHERLLLFACDIVRVTQCILSKLGVRDRTRAVLKALERGYI